MLPTRLYVFLAATDLCRLSNLASAPCRFYDYAAQHTAAEMLAEEERAVLATQLAQELKEAQAAEAAAAEAAAAQSAAHAATAAASAANTDVAQAMDTTAGSDDAFDAVAQDTVNAARSMTGDIAAPAAVTAADSTAADDAPVADAPPDAPSIAVPAPDDIAATLMAASTATTSDAAIPTAAALDSTPAAVTASFPASAPPAAAGLLPPQDAAAVPPHLAAPTVIPPTADTEMQEAVIPQTDGPADDPMETLESEAAPMDTTMASPEAAAAVIIATEAAVLPSQVAVPSAVLAPPIAIAPSQAPADGPADGAVADTSDAAAGVQPTHGLAEALADSAVSTAAGAGAAAPGTAESQAPSTQVCATATGGITGAVKLIVPRQHHSETNFNALDHVSAQVCLANCAAACMSAAHAFLIKARQ